MKPQNPIAVVGMAGLFPGAVNLNTFWHNIVNKVNSVCEADRNRWHVDPDSMVSPGFQIDKAYAKNLQRKMDVFRKQTHTHKQLFMTLISSIASCVSLKRTTIRY